MEKREALSPELVSDFVGNSHGDFDRVKELLAQEPALLNAAWDWGGGDWETGLGAASHMGRKDIALFLIEQGARTDIFSAAMLGELETVQSILAAHPHLATSKGPHGISLLNHAKAGAEQAEAVLHYLETLS